MHHSLVTRLSQHRLLIPLLVVLLSMVLQLQVLKELSTDSPYFDVILRLTDQYRYVERANLILAGEYPQDEPFLNSPYYNYFLAGMYALGQNNFLTRYLQILLSLVTCALTYQIGQWVFGYIGGVASAFVLAIYGPAIFYNQELTVASHEMFFVVTSIFALLNYQRCPHLRYVVLAGVCIGLGTLGQPQVIVLLPTLGFWLLWKCRARWWQGVLTMSLPVIILVALPTLHNALVANEFGIITTTGMYNLYIGNHPEATGLFGDGIDAEIKATYDNRDYFNAITDYVTQQPIDWLVLTGKKLVFFLLLSDAEMGSNMNYYYWGVLFSPTLQRLPIAVELISLIILVTLPLLIRQRYVPLLLGSVVMFMLATVAVFVQARFRMIILPLAIILMVGGIQGLIVMYRHPSKRLMVWLLVFSIVIAYVAVAIRYRLLIIG